MGPGDSGELAAALSTWGVVHAPSFPLLALLMMARHWPEVDARRDTFTADFGANLMAGLAPRALLFSTGNLIRNSFYYQQLWLGRRPDVTLVEQPMMAAPWYVTQLRRRHALRLPDTMTVYVGATDTGSRAWLDSNLGRRSPEPRPVAAIRFIDDSWAAAYRMRTMGIWSAVEPRASAVNLAAWCDSFSNTVREWRLPSLGREYGKTRWETTEGIFHPYALGRLKALRELLGEREPGGSPRAAVPALDVADGWRGLRRAEYLAYQADGWQSLVGDPLVPGGSDLESICTDRACALAESSLALEPENLQALQTLAALRHSVPRYRDPRAEAALRLRIVEQRPGDLAELEPYFELVVGIMRDPAPRDPTILDRAEAVRRRYLSLLELCPKVWNHGDLVRLQIRWSAPLAAAIAAP